MALNVTNKAASTVSSTPSSTIQRQNVSIGRNKVTSARVDALKARLMGKSTPEPALKQPSAPRPARTSARAEGLANLQQFAPSKPAPQGATSARQAPEDLSAIAPPPSGATLQPSPTVEAPASPPEATEQPLSSQFVALAQKERQLRKAQKELKAAQDAWKQEQANYIPKARLSSETLKVLSEAGITPDKLVELQVNEAQGQDPNQALLNRITELENQLQGVIDPENGILAKRDKTAYDSAVAQIQRDAELLVNSNPAFGTIKSEGKTKDVTELVTAVFNEEGIVLDVEEAAQLIEKKLQQNIQNDFQRWQRYEWLKAKAEQEASTPPEANTVQQTQPTQTTLTNAGASSRPLSPRDRAVLRVQANLDAAKGR